MGTWRDLPSRLQLLYAYVASTSAQIRVYDASDAIAALWGHASLSHAYDELPHVLLFGIRIREAAENLRRFAGVSGAGARSRNPEQSEGSMGGKGLFKSGKFAAMARPERFELPTYSSGGCRSIQLSYGRVAKVYILRSLTSNFLCYEGFSVAASSRFGFSGQIYVSTSPTIMPIDTSTNR